MYVKPVPIDTPPKGCAYHVTTPPVGNVPVRVAVKVVDEFAQIVTSVVVMLKKGLFKLPTPAAPFVAPFGGKLVIKDELVTPFAPADKF